MEMRGRAAGKGKAQLSLSSLCLNSLYCCSSTSINYLQQTNAMKKKKRGTTTSAFFRPASETLQALLIRHSRRLHLLLPLLSAVAGAILFVFAVISFLFPPITNTSLGNRLDVDGEIKSPGQDTGAFIGRNLWSSASARNYSGCSQSSDTFLVAEAKTHPDRYLLIVTSGGLNQQRTGITDAVVAAYMLNATLVVPKLDQQSYWKDASKFDEIFDVDWFISSLSRDVKIIKQLPENGTKVITPHHMRIPRKCTPECYETRVLPFLKKKHAVQLGKFDYRLSNQLDTDLQKLRCRANYHALQFTPTIREMGAKLVHRMRMKSRRYITLHLRFEPDMLAFSGCDYGGGEKEQIELGAIKKRWKGLHKNPLRERRQGRCPLTPEEVGLMLRALGFGEDDHIYVASGEIYGGEETLAPLKALFPNFHSKETLASKEELAPFLSFSSRMAALDFIVCDESDVFVTNNNGNMARILAGKRRYFGHKRTIRPNAKKLNRVFMDRANMTWEDFARRVQMNQIGFMGEPDEVKPGKGVFHEHPLPCICKKGADTFSPIIVPEKNTKRDTSEMADELSSEDELGLSDTDYPEIESGIQKRKLNSHRKDLDSALLQRPEKPEVEEALFLD